MSELRVEEASTSDDIAAIQAVIDRYSFGPPLSAVKPHFGVRVSESGGGFELRLTHYVPDRDTGETVPIYNIANVAPFNGAKLNVATLRNFLEKLLETVMLHELYESLKFDGIRFRDPHDGDPGVPAMRTA